MKKFWLIIGLIGTCNANAAINCIGVPYATKVGEYGAQESYLIVTVNNLDFRLGSNSGDDSAKARLALATTALTANKQLLLKFFDYADCSSASTAKVVPNSVQLIQN
jgi:hypothetical protein